MKKLLIVDDEILLVQSIIDRVELDLDGVEVINKETGSDGIKAIEAEKFDVVILDMMLPLGSDLNLPKEEPDLMYGVYILRKIREKRPNLPVICYSVVNDPDTVRQIEAIGRSFYVCKLASNSFNELFRKLALYI